MNRQLPVLIATLASLAASMATWAADDMKQATLYKNPSCGCCEEYADYLRKGGFDVTVVPTHDLDKIKRLHNVPEALQGCHTTVVEGYVVEGHVPLKTLNRLLSEKPRIAGISLPGMPQGSPGMSGQKTGPFTIYGVGMNGRQVYATE